MSQTKLRYPTIYNPASQSAEEIVANFVIRLQEYNELFTAIKKGTMDKPPQHFMIQAQRGYGKTTLLLRLNHEMKNDKELSQWLLPVIFNEEQYNVHTLAKLWEEVIDVLEDQDESFAGLSDKIDSLYDAASPEEEIFKLLVNALKKENRKIVLLLDNFGEMIEKFTKKENQRLREVLITCKYMRIIGASSTILEFYYNYKEPLFDFFKVITLDELNSEETVSLLKRLSETYKAEDIKYIIETNPERIEALRRLTGGVPRTIVLLFEIFIDDVDGNSFKDLEAILDRITPLYKQRMENLSPQQQTIVDAIAQNWDAISTKDIAKKVRMSSKAVSSQLNQLEKNQLIEKQPTSTKNQLYRLRERFFNIYYLMRLGKRKNRNRVLWLVRFFELWFGEKELADRAKRHIKAMREGRLYYSHALCISQALAKTAIPYELQHKLLRETKEYLTAQHSELVKELDKSHREVLEEVTDDVFHERYSSARKKLLDDGVAQQDINLLFGNIYWEEKRDTQKAIEFYLKAIDDGNYGAMFNLALLYKTEFEDYQKAKEYYLMAVEKGHLDAMYNLALLYHIELKDYDKAKEYYLIAVEKGDADAMDNLGLLFKTKFKDYEKAKEYFLMAVDKEHLNAMFHLALLYHTEFKDYEKAKIYYSMAVEKEHIFAMFNLALLYHTEFKDYEKAEKYYLMAVEKGDVDAMDNLGLLYNFKFKNYEKAKKYYLMAVEKGDIDAMFNLALLYQTEFKDYEKAKGYYLMAVDKGDADAMTNLASLYEDEFRDYEKAKKYYLMAVEKGDTDAMNNLAWLYYLLRDKKEYALRLQKEAYKVERDILTAHTYIMILLWNNEIEEAIKIYKEIFNNAEAQTDVNDLVNSILLMLLTKKQYNFIYQLFKENKFDLKDKYKPVYFALLSLMGDEYKDEYLKMGSELKQTVDEVLSEIKKLEIDYA
jgi:TPR repeat protein